MYSSSVSADVSGPPIVLSVSKSLIHPLCIARLAICHIMQALFLKFFCPVFHINTIVDILSHFIITHTSNQPERPWLSSVNQICCLGLNSTKDALASYVASCLELLVYEANIPLSMLMGAFSSFCVSIWETEYSADSS